MAKGLAHEEACLAEFEARGLSIFRTPGREDHETFAQWVSRVGNPMGDGWDVIYQFPMVHDGLRGIADFLVRVPEPTEGYAPTSPTTPSWPGWRRSPPMSCSSASTPTPSRR